MCFLRGLKISFSGSGEMWQYFLLGNSASFIATMVRVAEQRHENSLYRQITTLYDNTIFYLQIRLCSFTDFFIERSWDTVVKPRDCLGAVPSRRHFRTARNYH
jgi:hypothetical protein